MRIDGSDGQPLGFDNMQNRPVRATTDWQRYEVVLDVPEEGLNIAFGVLLVGSGQVWIDELSIETIGQDIPTTNLFSQPTG